jgi:DNA-binding NarL/FixJ family response regulator
MIRPIPQGDSRNKARHTAPGDREHTGDQRGLERWQLKDQTMDKQEPITILLVDDQSITRSGLRMRLELESDMTVVGEASDGAAGLALDRATHPTVVVMNIAMPVMDGLAATAALRATLPESAVVIHSLYDDRATQEWARDAGACAFVSKHSLELPLLDAIREAGAAH